ncbi:hypothetical protein FAM09_30365 [Niastella caeni]|uniref:Uncharacterized protein n=1 Tax=Niastella caeni TaxID=2569763 RepID=A0A4S8H5Z5_9BACT|nr:hypothetical protein [Niastella caeni]THU30208.1 hypothetical protein FAM09_30365 [Niastella caeni]
MNTHAGRQRRFPAVAIVVVLFILCIVPGQFWITKQFPAISGLVQINPSLIFLDIPIHIPVAIDLILAPALFLLMYPLVILFFPSRRQMLQRVRAAFTGFFILLCCVLLGGLIYYLVQDHLSMQVKNGINSLGIIADIHLSYPGHETIYLRGSLVLFVCFVIGLFICIRKIRKEPAGQLTREQRMTPYERMLQEKRMKEKQMMQETRKFQQEDKHQADKSRKPDIMEQKTIVGGRHVSGLCSSQPVMTIRPEAVYYMPK